MGATSRFGPAVHRLTARLRTGRLFGTVVAAILCTGMLPGVFASITPDRARAAQGCPAWELLPSPGLPDLKFVLSSVSAVSRDDIWAVGYTLGVGGAKTLTEHWDGKAWKVVPSPNPAPGDNYLDGVDALAPDDAWAIGDTGTPDDPGSVLLHWNGKEWDPVPLPEGSSLGAYAYAMFTISAAAPDDIWAAGGTGEPQGWKGIVLHYDGKAWSIHLVRDTPRLASIFYSIEARGHDDVWVVGARPTRGSVRDLQLHWDGKDWSEVQVEPQGVNAYMREAWDVAFAPGTNDRWVVGNLRSTPNNEAAILHFRGATFERTGENLRVLDRNYLTGVVALSPTEAWAVGRGETGAPDKTQRQPLIAHTTNGSDWEALRGATEGGDGALYDIAAIPGTNGELMAVGTYNNAPLVEMYTDRCAPPASPPTPAVPVASIPGAGERSRTFNETGKSARGIFLDYWDKHGGLPQQGFPISEMFTEVSALDGKPYTVQYFERAVFEYHPENQSPYDVLLSQLGTFRYKQKYPNGVPNQQPNTSAGAVLFPETGKHAGGRFLEYWQKNGGLAQQGYPISEEFVEKSDLDGKEYRVQYFERAVFELHPENQPPYDVLLSQLGTFQYRQKYGGR